MCKRLTIDYVRNEFLKELYILLTKVYINSFQKLEYICPEGHKHSIIWNDWQQGKRCPICAVNDRRLSIKSIKKSFKGANYNLLTEKYINAHQKLEYVCPKGHKHSMRWNDWNKGCRCPTCAGVVKPTIKLIKKSFENDKYKLLTKEYKNFKQKLEYICPKGHKHAMRWGSWQHGCRCPTCAAIKMLGRGNPNWKGGISKEPYCQDWTSDLKKFVKERDGYKCMNPICWGKDDMLHVHHINYNKKSCGPENLITICRSCNSRANFDRNWHEAWYKAILYRRYNYI